MLLVTHRLLGPAWRSGTARKSARADLRLRMRIEVSLADGGIGNGKLWGGFS